MVDNKQVLIKVCEYMNDIVDCLVDRYGEENRQRIIDKIKKYILLSPVIL